MLRYLFLLYALPIIIVAAEIPPDLRSAFTADRYKLQSSSAPGYHAWNAAGQFNSAFHDNTTEIETHGKCVTFTLAAFGWGGRTRTPGAVTQSTASGVRLNRVYASGLREWFANDPQGLEQSFVIGQRRGAGSLTLRLSLSADWRLQTAADGVAFVQAETRLDYSGLKAWDARGLAVPARVRADGQELVMEVGDSDTLYPLTVGPAFIRQASTGQGDGFELSVALSRDDRTALVGALQRNVGANSYQGVAYVYARDGAAWTETQQLKSSDWTAADGFGASVALSADGSTALVGAPDKAIGASRWQGVAYVFRRAANTWIEQQVLTAADGVENDVFGFSAALSDDGRTALLGAPYKTVGSNTQQGAAYVFVGNGKSWSQQAELRSYDGSSNSQFGAALTLSADGSTAHVATLHSTAPYAFIRRGPMWSLRPERTADGSTELTAPARVAAPYKTMLASTPPGAACVADTSSAASLSFAAQPSNGLAGAALSPAVAVQVRDANGNLVVTSTAAVTLASSPAGVVATANAVNGIATFNSLLFTNAGSYTFIAAGTGLVSATSSLFTISAGSASKLVFTTQPSNGVAGKPLSPVLVEVQDAWGNLVASSTASITLTSTPPSVTSTVAAVNGIATFNALQFTAAGNYTLTASATGLTAATSSSFTITAGSASKLAFTTQPSNGIVGTPISPPAVELQDTWGNLVASSTAVTLASTPPSVTSTVAAVNGIATFSSLQFTAAGNYTLTASATGLTAATSSSFTITAALASKLVFVDQPSGSLAGTGLLPVEVEVQDSLSNPVVSSTAPVTLTSSPAGIKTTVNAVSAIAIFNGLTLTVPGTYTLTASSPGLTSSTSNSFNIVSATYTISGQVTWNAGPLSGVTVALSGGPSAISGASGNYSFTALLAGSNYTVTPSLAGYTFNPPSQTFTNLGSNQTANFTAASTGTNITVSGEVTVSGNALAGVTINVNGSQAASTVTNASGTYSIVLPQNGTYILSTALAAYSFSGPFTLSSLSANQTVNFIGIPVPGLDFYALAPCRIADTRTGAGFSGQFGPPSLAAGTTRTFVIPASACGVPATATAYSLNFTVVPPSGGPPANLTTWPAGLSTGMPNVSTLNYSGATVANAAIGPAGTNNAINVFVDFPADVLFDINGYFAPPLAAGLMFYPVTPCRIADTRTGAGFSGQFGPPSLAGNATRTFTLPDASCGIPLTASAYSLNFTAIPPAGGPSANLTTWPATQPVMPNVSTLNFSGSTVANAAIVPAGTNEAIDVFVNYPTNLLFDVNGYFAPASSSGLHFYPVTPCRIADTRAAAGFTGQFGPPSLAAGTTRTFTVPAGTCGIPPTASAYSLNFTVIPPAGGPPANLTTWPATSSAMPNVSTLNFSGSIVANAAVVPAGISGAINVYVDFPTDLLFDINGYFAP